MSYQEYQVVSCEPTSLLDQNGEPYEVFGNSFIASEGEKPQCVNTEADGKFIYRTTSANYSVQLYIGETQILASNFTAPSGGHTVTGNVSISSGQFNGVWGLIVPLGNPGATQGFVFEAEELDDPNNVGFKVIASHDGTDLKMDLYRKTHN